MSQKKVYSIINHKGGVGKTTNTSNLGTAMAEGEEKERLRDVETKGNVANGIGVSPSRREVGCNKLIVWL